MLSRVLPTAMAIEVETEPAVVTFTRKAPSKIAGQMRYPSTKAAANAIPVGGHTAVALAFTKASRSPNLPAAK